MANATLGSTALQQAYEEQRRKNIKIGAIVGGVALIVAILFGLKASVALGIAGSDPKDKLLAAKGSTPSAVLTLPGKNGTPVMEQPAQKPPDNPMPDDVYQWLKHLEKCEAIKNELIGDQFTEMQVFQQKLSALGSGIGLTDPYEESKGDGSDEAPGSYTSGKIKDLRPKWQELLTYFRSKRPPVECQPIADDFDSGLNEITGEIGDITDILNMADSDPQHMLEAAKKSQNKSYGIDRLLISCDQKVGGICMKYKVNKWFNINPDPMSGGALGKIGNIAPPTGFVPGVQ